MLSTDKILQMMEDPDHESLPFALDQEIVSSALSTEPGEPERSFHKSGPPSPSHLLYKMGCVLVI